MARNPKDRDKPAISNDDVFLEAKERFSIAETVESDNRLNGLKALKFRYIPEEQWDSNAHRSRMIEQRPCLTINHTDAQCLRVQNQLKQQRPRIKCQPMGGAASQDKANVINSLIRHIQNLSNADLAYDQGVTSAQDIGWGYWEIAGEYCDHKTFDQELKIKRIRNAFTVYDDPLAMSPSGVEDRKWLFIAGKMSRGEYRRKYPQAPNKDWNAAAVGDNNMEWENKDQVRVCRYFRIMEVPDTLIKMQDGRTALKSEYDKAPDQIKMAWMPALTADEKMITRPTVRAQVQVFVLGGCEVLEKRDLPGKYIPVIRCLGNEVDIEGRILRWGMVKNMMDPGRMFNYWESARTEVVALAPKAPWVVAEGQTDNHPEWDDANRRPYSKLVYTPVVGADGQPVPPPQRQPPTPIPEGQNNASQMALMNLVAMAGMPQENPMDQSRVVSGNKYMQRRQRERDLMHFQYSDNQAQAVIWTGIILLDLIPYYYDTDRMQRIVDPSGEAKMVRINAEDGQDEQSELYQIAQNLRDGTYDIVPEAGPDYRTAQEEGAEGMLGILDTPLGPKVADRGADLVIRNMPWAGAQELADRMLPDTPEGMKTVVDGLPPQAKSLVMGLQQQIAQLTQVTQQQALELKYKGSIEAAKIESANQKSEREDKTKRHDIEVRSTTQRDVAEINAAAQLLNTKAESDEAERASNRLIQKGLD